MSPLVSILIPCYNAEKYVGESIESALAQTHPSVEVVVVDDGSTDGSVEVVRGFGDRVVFEAGPNRGACAARNRALVLCKGEYIQFLDADDLLMPNKIERQLPILTRGDADLVFSRGTLFGDGKPERTKKMPIRPIGDTDAFIYCLYQGISTEDPLHRRKCLETVGGFCEDLPRGQEYELHMRLAASGVRLYFLDEVLSRHRHHAGPRITRTPRPADSLLNLLLQLSVTCEGRQYRLDVPRRSALAGAIYQNSINSYRKGCKVSAITGFARARKLSPSFTYNERSWYRIGTRLVGPLVMEWALARVRSVFGRRAAESK